MKNPWRPPRAARRAARLAERWRGGGAQRSPPSPLLSPRDARCGAVPRRLSRAGGRRWPFSAGASPPPPPPPTVAASLDARGRRSPAAASEPSRAGRRAGARGAWLRARSMRGGCSSRKLMGGEHVLAENRWEGREKSSGLFDAAGDANGFHAMQCLEFLYTKKQVHWWRRAGALPGRWGGRRRWSRPRRNPSATCSGSAPGGSSRG